MASGGMPSGPAAFPFFRFLMALLTSSLLGLLPSTYKNVSAGAMSGISLGGGLFRSSLKWSAHLLRCSSWSVSNSALLALTGLSRIFLEPAIFFVMEYSSFMSPLLAVSSAFLVRLSTKFRLSFLKPSVWKRYIDDNFFFSVGHW